MLKTLTLPLLAAALALGLSPIAGSREASIIHKAGKGEPKVTGGSRGADEHSRSSSNEPMGHARALADTITICKEYSDSGACLYCFRDQYMMNEACLDVPEPSLIAHCNIYLPELTCHECDAGFVLSADKRQCAAGPVSLNCDVFRDNTSCISCAPGSRTVGGQCVAIGNCAKADTSGCVECLAGFYPQDGACKAVPAESAVAGCAVYKSERLCAACGVGTALSSDARKCLTKAEARNQIDPNCLRSYINNGEVCSACVEGYYLKNGICEKCLQSESCLICDPKAPQVCLLCRPKYFMTSGANGSCALNVELSSQMENRDPLQTASEPLTRAVGAFLAFAFGLAVISLV